MKQHQSAGSGDFAVYSEMSPSSKRLTEGANPRVFNNVDIEVGNSIRLNQETGAVTLRPGLYHITASSIVTYFTEADTDGKVTTADRPNGSYSMLRYWTDSAERGAPSIALGTVSTANMVPSLIETYLLVEDEDVDIQVVHQAGADVDGLYLQVYVDDSSDHVFARISIRRL